MTLTVETYDVKTLGLECSLFFSYLQKVRPKIQNAGDWFKLPITDVQKDLGLGAARQHRLLHRLVGHGVIEVARQGFRATRQVRFLN